MVRASRIRPLRRAAAWEHRFWQALEAAVPGDVQSHLRTARTEILRAVKSAADEAVARSERATRGPRQSRRPAGDRQRRAVMRDKREGVRWRRRRT